MGGFMADGDSGLNPDPGQWPRPQPASWIPSWLHGMILSFSCEIFYTFFNYLNKLWVSQRFLCLGNSRFQDGLDSEVHAPAQVDTFNTKFLATLFFFPSTFSQMSLLHGAESKLTIEPKGHTMEKSISWPSVFRLLHWQTKKEINNGINCS